MRLVETPERARGFGARRFLVERNGLVSVEAAAQLRLRYNEYPERPALDPAFPVPGRRGPSRVIDLRAPGAVAPPAPGPVYPSGVPIDDRATPVPTAVGPSTGLSPIVQSIGDGGFVLSSRINIAAGVTSVVVSERIAFPFLIVAFQGVSGFPFGTVSVTGVRVKVSSDNSTAGGESTSGDDVQLGVTIAGRFFTWTTPMEVYPNFRVLEYGRFIKIITFNGSAGAADYMNMVSVMPLS